MSIKDKVNSLIDAGNAVTGESKTDLTSVMQDLVDGYGQGGSDYPLQFLRVHSPLDDNKLYEPTPAGENILKKVLINGTQDFNGIHFVYYSTEDIGFTATVTGTATDFSGTAICGGYSADKIFDGGSDDVTWTLSGCPSGGSDSTYAQFIRCFKDGETISPSGGITFHDYGDGVSVTGYRYAIPQIGVYEGYTCPPEGILFVPNLSVSVDMMGFNSVVVNSVKLQAKTNISPTESIQTITADDNYDGLSSVRINAIDPIYVGSEVPRRDWRDVTFDVGEGCVIVPPGFYEEDSGRAMPEGTVGTPLATKGTVSNHSVSITPSIAITAGFVGDISRTGTAVSVSASELVSGTKSINANGTEDVTNYESVSVNVPSGDPNENLIKKLSNTLTSLHVDLGGNGLGQRAMDSCTSLQTAFVSGLTIAPSGIANTWYAFNGCTNLKTLVMIRSTSGVFGSYAVSGCKLLEKVDLSNFSSLNGSCFASTAKNNFKTLILRRTSIVSLSNVNAFNDTPFKSGGTGGTIYIPKSLYDHLNDGTSLDYKSATNWSTVNGYGTITWATIEGSIYENSYADGTPIS